MWAWDPSKEGIARGRKEEELARYFKLEYGEAEVDRLMAQARGTRRSSPGGVWSRLRARVARQREDGEAVTSAPSHPDVASPVKEGVPTLPVECRHPDWEALGSGGSATYLQCRACGAMVVSQGGRLWGFPRNLPEGI